MYQRPTYIGKHFGRNNRSNTFRAPPAFISSNLIPTEYGPAPTGWYTHRLGEYYRNPMYPGSLSTPPINPYAYRDPRYSEQSRPNTGQANRDLEAARAELAQYKQNIVQLQAALSRAGNNSRKKQQLEAALAQATKGHTNSQGDIRRLQAAANASARKAAELEAALEAAERKQRETENRLAAFEQTYDNVLANYNQGQEAIKGAKDRIAELEAQLGSASANASTRQRLQAEIRRLLQAIPERELDLQRARREIDRIQGMINQTQREFETSEAAQRGLEEQLRQAQQETAGERTRREAAEAQITELRERLESLGTGRSREAADLRERITELERGLAAGRAAEDAERRRRTTSEAQLEDLRRELATVPNRSVEAADLRRQIDELRASLAARNAEEEELNRQLISARTALNAATRSGVRDPAEIARLQGEIDDLSQRLRDTQSLIPAPGYINAERAAALRQNVAIAQRDATQLQRDLDNANRRLAATTNPREVNNLKRRANYYKKRLVNAFRDIDRLKRASRTTRRSPSGPPTGPPTRKSPSGPPTGPPTRKSPTSSAPGSSGSSCGPGKSWKCKNPKPPTRGGGQTMRKKRYSGGSCKTWKCRPTTRG